MNVEHIITVAGQEVRLVVDDAGFAEATIDQGLFGQQVKAVVDLNDLGGDAESRIGHEIAEALRTASRREREIWSAVDGCIADLRYDRDRGLGGLLDNDIPEFGPRNNVRSVLGDPVLSLEWSVDGIRIALLTWNLPWSDTGVIEVVLDDRVPMEARLG